MAVKRKLITYPAKHVSSNNKSSVSTSAYQHRYKEKKEKTRSTMLRSNLSSTVVQSRGKVVLKNSPERQQLRSDFRRAQGLCESGGGRPVPNSPYGLRRHKATLNLQDRAQELYESGGGRPGLPVPNKSLRSPWT